MAATVNLRSFPFTKQLNCPHCKQDVTVYDQYGSEYVVCGSCQSYCKIIATEHLQAQQTVAPIKWIPVLPLGTEGTLMGNAYKVIAYMEKKESGTDYEWSEYMLYSYIKGYAFLAEYNGHWSFIAGKQQYPEVDTATYNTGEAELNGVKYKQYNRYTPVITALIGEFDWDAYHEHVTTREFISPPYILVREVNKSRQLDSDWYFGEYLEPEEIAAAFNIPLNTFPDMVDIGANQPNPYKKRWLGALWVSGVAAALVIAFQIILSFVKPEQLIVDKTVPLSLPPVALKDSIKRDSLARTDSATLAAALPVTNGNFEYQPLRTSSFTIYNGPAPLKVELYAPADNNWFEATVELVNEADNQSWDVSKEIEYYHGYEDGESWSEGSTAESVTIEDVPKGKYHLNIYPYAGTTTFNSMNIKVTANVMLWQNFIITILLLCIIPLLFWFLTRRYEVNRWMFSDYSPYKKDTTDD